MVIAIIEILFQRKELQGSILMEAEQLKTTRWKQEIIGQSDQELFKTTTMITTTDYKELGLSLNVYYILGLLKSKLEEWIQKTMDHMGTEIKTMASTLNQTSYILKRGNRVIRYIYISLLSSKLVSMFRCR
jgi:hypothetical protein